MNTFKSALARTAVAVAIVVLSGCASLEGPYNDNIVASMQESSQGGGE